MYTYTYWSNVGPYILPFFLVDRGLVNQQNFKPTWDGHSAKFNDWKFKFTNLCCSKYPGADKVLKLAQDEKIQARR